MNRVRAQYIFVDVVSYTSKDIEAQLDVVQALQKIVKQAIESFDELDEWWEEKVNYLPTGDGMCIVIENVEDSDDIHIRVAEKVLSLLDRHNTQGKGEPFQLRIGINENKDLTYKDINGNKNYAGRGINYAQRVMTMADPGKIFVGSMVYEKLADTRAYKGCFTEHKKKLKNGEIISIYEYDGLRF